MSGYTVKNLKEVDDSAAGSGDVEARFGRRHLNSEHLGVSYFRYGPGARASVGHRHRERGLELIAIGADRPGGGDGEMVENFWADR